VPAHVLRFWESQFSFLQPLRRSGGRRFYRPADIVALRELRRLLHDEHWSIKQVQALPRRRPPGTVASPARGGGGLDTVDREPAGLRAALDRAQSAKRALDRLLGSSTV